MEPLKIVPLMPPVEATIRILLSSVPYLIGAAVVRQPAGPDAVAADVGRNPWLFDRRLTSLELPDDALPANRAVALDWPVPYQAEWVGVPPRLLISRLVFADRTVGVLLGTLITREQLSPQTREAIDLSCELIASAVAMDTPAMYVAPEPVIKAPDVALSARSSRIERPESASTPAPATVEPAASGSAAFEPASGSTVPRSAGPQPAADRATPNDASGRGAEILDEVGRAAAAAGDARAVARVLRDATNGVVSASAFTVSLFRTDRSEVAYRYKVVAVDAAASDLAGQPVDDGAECAAVRGGDRWFVFERAVTVGTERRRVAVLQVPLRDGGAPIGVVTLQTFREGDFTDAELRLIAAITDATEAAFAAARAAGRFQRAADPEFTLSRSRPAALDAADAETAPADAADADTADADTAPAPAKAHGPSAEPALSAPAPPEPLNDELLTALLERFASAGSPTAFVVGLDATAGMLRGVRVSPSAADLDAALGISAGRFAVSLDDRYNAIARACREGRDIEAPTIHELVQPAHEWPDAAVLERLAAAGHATILPIVVEGSVLGAIVAGPGFADPDAATVERLHDLVADVARELAAVRGAASIGESVRSVA